MNAMAPYPPFFFFSFVLPPWNLAVPRHMAQPSQLFMLSAFVNSFEYLLFYNRLLD